MHAFQSIAIQKNTSLAVVAPSIAEALFATAIGLIAAIPAYIAFNKFSTDAGKFAGRLEGFADDLSTAIQRRLAEQGLSHGALGQRRLRGRAAGAAAARGRGRRGALSEINVTPLVDVMLVLLIVFMISAPLLTAGVPVELPKTEAGAAAGPDRAADRLDPRRRRDLHAGGPRSPFANLGAAAARDGRAATPPSRSTSAPTARRPTRSWPR